MGKFCSNCGNELKEGDLFCGTCGTKAGELPQGKQVESEAIKTENVNDNSCNNVNTVQKSKKKSGCGCLIVIIATIIGITIAFLSAGGGKATAAIDDAFLEQMKVQMGANCVYTISDHRTYYDDSLDEYIGTGSFTQSGIKYTYNFRAIIKDNTIIFIKENVLDPVGNAVMDFYDMDKETEHLGSIESK